MAEGAKKSRVTREEALARVKGGQVLHSTGRSKPIAKGGRSLTEKEKKLFESARPFSETSVKGYKVKKGEGKKK